MDPENMLSQRRQAQKAIYDMIQFIWNNQNSKSIETEGRLVVARGWGGEKGEWLLNHGYGVSFPDNKNALELESGDICTTMWMH